MSAIGDLVAKLKQQDLEPSGGIEPLDTGQYLGFDWKTSRGPLGNLNGYVRLPEDHPLFGKWQDDEAVADIGVHGGITFTALDRNNEWWVGFDTAHYNDSVTYSDGFTTEGRRWSNDDVVDEIKELITNLARQAEVV